VSQIRSYGEVTNDAWDVWPYCRALVCLRLDDGTSDGLHTIGWLLAVGMRSAIHAAHTCAPAGAPLPVTPEPPPPAAHCCAETHEDAAWIGWPGEGWWCE